MKNWFLIALILCSIALVASPEAATAAECSIGQAARGAALGVLHFAGRTEHRAVEVAGKVIRRGGGHRGSVRRCANGACSS